MDEHVKVFMREMFGDKFMRDLSAPQLEDFVTVMYTIIFSHRHQNVEETKFLKQTNEHLSSKSKKQLDFDVVRNPAYKYSVKVENEFFGHDIWSFLMVYFVENWEPKYGTENPVCIDQLKESLPHLKKKGLDQLKPPKPSSTTPLGKKLYSILLELCPNLWFSHCKELN